MSINDWKKVVCSTSNDFDCWSTAFCLGGRIYRRGETYSSDWLALTSSSGLLTPPSIAVRDVCANETQHDQPLFGQQTMKLIPSLDQKGCFRSFPVPKAKKSSSCLFSKSYFCRSTFLPTLFYVLRCNIISNAQDFSNGINLNEADASSMTLVCINRITIQEAMIQWAHSRWHCAIVRNDFCFSQPKVQLSCVENFSLIETEIAFSQWNISSADTVVQYT